MKKIMILLSFIILFTGCTFDPYENSSYGEKVIDSWFSYVTEDGEEIGKTRMKIEDISEIEKKECNFKEKNNNKYIFNCNITYKEIGETIIPLQKSKTKKVYAVFILNNDGTYNYKVYNSSSEEGIWLEDKELNYKGENKNE